MVSPDCDRRENIYAARTLLVRLNRSFWASATIRWCFRNPKA